MEVKPQRKRRAPAKTVEATQEVVSAVVPQEAPKQLPRSNESQVRIERLPSGLVIVHQ